MILFATCAKGLAPSLAAELTDSTVAATRIEPAVGGVSFEGTLETAYRACLWSRVASRVLMPLTQFPAADEEALYNGVRAIDWGALLIPDGTIAVNFTSSRSKITHTHYGALKTKDAIVDRLRDETGARPSVDTKQPDLRINVHLANDVADLSIDLSGESLHRRGYRRGESADDTPEAPLKETLAAGILGLARWPEAARLGKPFLDPMCGSGTLVIEAALMAAGRAPGVGRARFGFHGWRDHDEALWQRLLAEATAHKLDVTSEMVGSDADPRAIKAARAQAARAGVQQLVRFEERPLAELAPIGEQPGVLVTNPPYGERLEADEELYQQLGDLLRRNMLGWEAFVMAGNPELAARIGLRPRRRHVLFNGAIECRLLEIPIAAKPVQVEAPGWRRAREAPTAGAEFFVNRLRKNAKHWERWAAREKISCYRIYDADLPEFAVAIDRYEDAVHVQEYAPPSTIDPEMAEARLRDVMRAVPEILKTEQVFLKVRRKQKRGGQYERNANEPSPSVERQVHEGGLRFWVNLSDYLDTGLFLDQRRLRTMIGDQSKGKSFLNLFAYTATATLHAVRGGATSSVSVDLSNTYLEWARRNLTLNGVSGRAHELVRADVMEWLPVEKRRFDLIFVAPPTFSNSKGMEETLEVQRDHVALISGAARLLAPGGTILFSNHFRRFKMGDLPGLRAENITHKTMPKDFARNPRIHNAWRITSSKD